MRQLTKYEETTCDDILTALPEDKEEALIVFSSLTEAILHATDESIESFVDRLLWWRDRRP